MRLLRSKLFWFTSLLVAICLALMLWSGVTGTPSFLSNITGAIVTPLQNGLSKAADWVGDLFGYFYRYDALVEENQALREELAQYQALENRYYASVNQNTALREAAGIKQRHADYDLELCSVVAVAGSGFQSALTLSRGTLSGIEEGDPVITGDGLVGYVSEAGLNYCTVTTVINADFTASALISRTREVVVTEGNFELSADGYLKIAYLENDADIVEGDRVFTSGGGSFPPDLMIGEVLSVQPESHGVCSYATLKPAVTPEALNTVFVIKDFDVEN